MNKNIIIAFCLAVPTISVINASAECVDESADIVTLLGLPTNLADFEGEGWESSLEGVKVYERRHTVFGEFKINLNMPTMKMVFYRDVSSGDWKRIATIGAEDGPLLWNLILVKTVFGGLLNRAPSSPIS